MLITTLYLWKVIPVNREFINKSYFLKYKHEIEFIENELLNKSKHGYTAKELQERLKVFPHNVLLPLFKNNQIVREQIGNNFVYFSPDKISSQLNHRKGKIFQKLSTFSECLSLFIQGLNEKQLRLYAGLESIQIG